MCGGGGRSVVENVMTIIIEIFMLVEQKASHSKKCYCDNFVYCTDFRLLSRLIKILLKIPVTNNNILIHSTYLFCSAIAFPIQQQIILRTICSQYHISI